MVELSCAAATDVGRKRDHNEDNFLIDKKLRLFVVADGMGGHAAGEVASSIAVHAVHDTLHANRDLFDRFDRGDGAVAALDILQALEHAVQQACATINKRAQSEPGERGMGTTCSALLIAGPPGSSRGFIAHVGDSRIYLVRQKQAHQLTEDHSLANELVRRGRLRRDEIDQSPYGQFKNAVTRAVGVYESVEVETFDLDVLPGDNFLLCTDGLHAYVNEDEVARFLVSERLGDIPKALVDKANDGGGQDNITAVCVRVPGDDDLIEIVDARAEELALKLEVLQGMPLFRFLSYTELVRVMNITSSRACAPGERIILEGDAGDEMFVILRGTVRLDRGGGPIATLGRGAHFGEMSLIDRSPRSLSATACEESNLLAIRRKDFYEVIRKEPGLSVKLLWSFVQVLAERLRKTTSDLSGARQVAAAEDLSEEVLFDE